jgi:hypothetical protein
MAWHFDLFPPVSESKARILSGEMAMAKYERGSPGWPTCSDPGWGTLGVESAAG